MRIGFNSTGTNSGTLDSLIAEAALVDTAGLSSFWVPNYFGMDALTSLTVVGREVLRIELGTAVVPIYTRHPFAMAQQALTVQAAIGGRLVLGLGLSHKAIVEGAWGLDFGHPVADMRGYLAALAELIDPRQATSGPTPVSVPEGPVPPAVPVVDGLPIVVAALGPKMVEVAGRYADGVVLWCAGPRSVASIVSGLHAAAEADERHVSRVVAALPVCVTGDEAAVRSRIATRFSSVDALPSYRRSLDRDGARGIADIAVVGDPAAVRSSLRRLAEAGVTEFIAMMTSGDPAERQATIEVLAAAASDDR